MSLLLNLLSPDFSRETPAFSQPLTSSPVWLILIRTKAPKIRFPRALKMHKIQAAVEVIPLFLIIVCFYYHLNSHLRRRRLCMAPNMDATVPGFNKMNLGGVLPERAKGKNAVVLSQNSGVNHNDPNFLSDNFNRNPPRLFITAEDKEFDIETVNEWQSEGFQVQYVPMGKGGDSYINKLERMGKKKLGPCETFGIVGKLCPRSGDCGVSRTT